MASIIRIKRSQVSGNPAVLAAGEIAYSAADSSVINGGDRLYIGIGAETNGNAANHIVIGGKFFTDMLDHAKGTLTANSAIVVDENKKIDQINVDNITIDGNTISSSNSNGNILLDPLGSGHVEIVGVNGVVVPAGTTAQRGPSLQATIRFNTDNTAFEGFDGANWSSLGGVKSVDGKTYISAEATPGASDDTLRFYTDDVLRMSLDTDSLNVAGTIDVKIDSTTSSTDPTTGALVIAGGVGVGGDLNVAGDLSAANFTAGSVSLGNIDISGNTISSTNTNGDINLTPNGSGKVVLTNAYIGSDSILEYIQDITGGQLVGGESITVTYNDPAGTSTIDAAIATTTTRGVASFETDDFNVTTGAVELKDTVVKGLTVDGDAAVTPSGHSIKIQGGEGVDVTASGSVITVSGEDASSSNKGIASFSPSYFTVTAGDVAINNATTTAKGIASFNTDNFTVTDGAVSTKNITLGTSVLTNGSTTNSLEGLTSLTVDDINIDSSTISAVGTADDININLSPKGTGTVDVNNSRITSVLDPVASSDAATKLYVDQVAQGIKSAPAVRVLASTNLDATYDNGTNGVGATLTATSNGAFDTIDGVSDWSVGNGILLIGQTNQAHNGRYVLIQIGDGLTPWILRRCGKCDEATEIPSSYVFVQEGTQYANTGWIATVANLNTFTVGTDAIVWNQFSGAGTYLAGTGLSLDGTVFNVNLSATGGIEFSGANALQLKAAVAGDGLVYNEGVLDVVGTANRIAVSANSIDIASTYVGQTSITTLGTITSGTWQANKIAPQYGGTGVDNGNNTITIGGNLELAGNFTTKLSVTGDTDVILPTTGTLATLAGVETLTNKTINNSSIGSVNPSTAAFTTLSASGSVLFSNTTDATALGTAPVSLLGGLSVDKKVFVGSDIIGAGAAFSSLSGFNIDGGTY